MRIWTDSFYSVGKGARWRIGAFVSAVITVAFLFIWGAIAMAAWGTTLSPSQQPIPASLFDLNILFHPNDKVPWPAVTFHGWRAWHALWYDLEPQKGKWNFEHLDQLVDLAQQHHSEMLLMLAYSPQWASIKSDPQSDWQAGTAGPLRDLSDWREYVRAVATRYKGKIHVYEIWNEPDRPHAWLGDIDTMVQMAREASKILKEIDPTITVVSPSPETSQGVGWVDEFLRKGGGPYVDVIGYHFYVGASPPETMIPLIQNVKKVMADNHAGDKPLWNTEAGWHDPTPFPSEELAAAYVARSYVVNWAAGVARFYWYCWDEHKWASLRVTWLNGTLRPGAKAYASVQEWLTGAVMKQCSTSDNEKWVCEIDRGGNRLYIVWNTVGSSSFRIAKSWRVSNVTHLDGTVSTVNGNSVEIGVQPVLIR